MPPCSISIIFYKARKQKFWMRRPCDLPGRVTVKMIKGGWAPDTQYTYRRCRLTTTCRSCTGRRTRRATCSSPPSWTRAPCPTRPTNGSICRRLAVNCSPWSSWVVGAPRSRLQAKLTQPLGRTHGVRAFFCFWTRPTACTVYTISLCVNTLVARKRNHGRRRENRKFITHAGRRRSCNAPAAVPWLFI